MNDDRMKLKAMLIEFHYTRSRKVLREIYYFMAHRQWAKETIKGVLPLFA